MSENIAKEILDQYINQFVTCCICFGYLEGASEMTCCHNLYCEKCVAEWFRTNGRNSCSSCRHVNSSYIKNIPIQRLTDQIPLTCIYKVNGCNFSPPRMDFASHIAHCEYKNRRIQVTVATSILELSSNFFDRSNKIMSMIHQNPSATREGLQAELNTCNDPNVKSELRVRIADCLAIESKFDNAKVNYDTAFQSLITTHGENHDLVICCYLGLGYVNKKLGNYNEATSFLQKAIQIGRTIGGDDHPVIASQMISIGDIFRKTDKFDSAEISYRQAITTIERLPHEKQNLVELASAYRGIGLVFKKKADYDNALINYQCAIDLINSTGSAHHSRDLGNYLVDLGDVYRKRQQHNKALETYQKALEHIQGTSDVNMNTSADAAEVYYVQSLVFLSLQQDRQAFDTIEKARVILNNIYKQGHYKLGLVDTVLGRINSMRKNYTESIKYFMKAIDQLSKYMGPDHLDVADVQCDLADALLKKIYEGNANNTNSADSALAKDNLSKAQKIYEGKLGPNHTKVLQCQSLLLILNSNA